MHAHVQPAAPSQWTAALELLYRDTPPAQRPGRVQRAQHMLETGEFDRRGLLVARVGTELAGAMLCAPAPGAVGLIWPPRVRDPFDKAQIEDELVRAALNWLRSCGAKLAQALLCSEEEPRAGPLLGNGFERITTLLHLRQKLLTRRIAEDSGTLRFDPLQPPNEASFAATLEQTYVGTRDCPEVNGVRTVDEVLAGHRAQGVFDPAMWWLAHDGKGPVGVLLVNAVPEESSWEVVYLGIVPAARGQGYGGQLMTFALRQARHAGIQSVEVSVDCRNVFACQIYDSLGFELVNRRLVYLAALAPRQLS